MYPGEELASCTPRKPLATKSSSTSFATLRPKSANSLYKGPFGENRFMNYSVKMLQSHKFRVQFKRYHKNQVSLHKIYLYSIGGNCEKNSTEDTRHPNPWPGGKKRERK